MNVQQTHILETVAVETLEKLTFKKVLIICSLNAPSILKHKDEIDIFIIKENKIDILAINETKLDNRNKDDIDAIDDYVVKGF